jgi:phage terminase Nu1 subunit (DNA packaging protein)
VNLQAYANHRKALGLRGTSHVAVLKAIERGRLMAPAVERKGRGWEINPELADQQWADTTHPAERGSGHHRGQESAAADTAPTQRQEPARQATAQRQETATPKGVPPRAVSEAVLAAVKAKRETMALQLDEKKLLRREDVELAWGGAVNITRTRLLGVPSTAKQRIPHLEIEEVELLTTLIREALDELAAGEVKA